MINNCSHVGIPSKYLNKRETETLETSKREWSLLIYQDPYGTTDEANRKNTNCAFVLKF